jgi:hypothetical protein
LKQPVAGLVATALVIAVSLLYISLWDFPTFAGWASYCLVAIVPVEVMIGVIWGYKIPSFAASKPQPLKGILLTLTLAVIAGIFGVVYFQTAGGGIGPPTPMMTQCMIVCVAVSFFLCIPFGGWPFTTLIKDPMWAGIATLAGAYILNYILFRIFFNYQFLVGAPVYVESLDPKGMFNGWNALVFYLSALFVMFVVLHFDLWPMTKFPGIMKQPVLGIVWTTACIVLGGIAYHLAVNVSGMDVARYMVTGPVAFIFGTIVLLNMLQGSFFAKMTQPVKGVVSTLTAAVLGTLLARMYLVLMPSLTGNLASGPPPYEQEIWLASALLGVTFPFMVLYAEFFGFWPLKKS